MEQNFDKSSQSLGIAALIIAIITFIIAIIPCIGLFALIPGIVAIVLGIVGLTRSGAQVGRGMLIAGLVIGLVAVVISSTQWAMVGSVSKGAKFLGPEFEQTIRTITDQINEELDRGDISIRIQSGDETVEIKTSIDKQKLEEGLEKLEKLEKLNKLDTMMNDLEKTLREEGVKIEIMTRRDTGKR
jgi:hypothetical protein